MDQPPDYYIDEIDTCINEVVINEESDKNDNNIDNIIINSKRNNNLIINNENYKTDNETIVSDDTYITDNAIVQNEDGYMSEYEITSDGDTYKRKNGRCTDSTYKTDSETNTTEYENNISKKSYLINNYLIKNKKDCENEFPIDNIETYRAFSFENNTSLVMGYESSSSESTLAMTISEAPSINFEKSLSQKQLKDISNNILLRPRRSIKIKNESPIECIEIQKKPAPIPRKETEEVVYECTEIPEEYYEGRLLWGKLKTYPWWPCMIYRSPDKIFYKKNLIHVVYFGPRVERGWISINDIFSYDGKDKFDEIVNKLIAENAPKKVLQDYNYPKSKISTYNGAWKEAESALFKKISQRIKSHGIMYKDPSGKCIVTDLEDSDEDDVSVSVPSTPNLDTLSLSSKKQSPLPSSKTFNNFIHPFHKHSPQLTVSLPTMPNIYSLSPSPKQTKSASLPTIPSITNQQKIIPPSTPKTPRITPVNLNEINDNMSIVSVNSSRSIHSSVMSRPQKRQRPQKLNISKNDDNISVASSRPSVTVRPIVKPTPQKLILEYLNLKAPTFAALKRTPICLLCLGEKDETSDHIITCSGLCTQTFHVSCISLLLDYLTSKDEVKPVLDRTKCVDCNRNQRRCFMCRKFGCVDKHKDMVKCSNNHCGRQFHVKCLNDGVYRNLVSHNRHGSVTCPSHTCHSCHLDNPATVRHANSHVRCIMCPASFHRGEWCIPAGSKEINSFFIICPQHLKLGGAYDLFVAPFMNCIANGSVILSKYKFKLTSFTDPLNTDLWTLDKPLTASKSKPFNVTWCFICSKGGDLICCEKCPASLHQHCAQVDEIPESFICDECELGKYPRYGEIFWLKIGNYRWWPAQIIHSKRAPPRVMNAVHGDGQFLVLFFGTNDYHWCNKTQAFMFDENDCVSPEKNDDSSSDENNVIPHDYSKNNLERAYDLSLKTAGKAYKQRSKKWEDLVANGNQPNHYRKIRNNIPIGKVRINKNTDASTAHQCECRPGLGKNDNDPCGPTSDCINRQLNYECNPLYCRNGVKCRNQRFMLRQYPKLETFSTQDRGWALRTVEPIKQGTFVIEYIGEVIDEEESNRRLKTAHDNNVSNFYMMELDSQRIIDAGPAANISRFMNHSCSPNMFTQRWTVNGDIRVGIFALHNIKAKEELTFNYNFLSLGEMKIPCKCGASNCSGFLGVPPKDHTSQDTTDTTHSVTRHHNKPPKKTTATTKSVPDRTRAPKTKRDIVDHPVPIKKVNLDPGLLAQEPKKSLLLEEVCFICRDGVLQCDVTCHFDGCGRRYHSDRCLALQDVPTDVWYCPCHFCDDCGKVADSGCHVCTVSFCVSHLADRIVVCDQSGLSACLEHKLDTHTHSSPPRHQINTELSSDRTNTESSTTPISSNLISDSHCFLCRSRLCNVSCSYEQCSRVYHYRCLGMTELPSGAWFCPSHFCDDCGRLSDKLCKLCNVSFCVLHVADRVINCFERGPMWCMDHYEMYNFLHDSGHESF